ncbi:MAG: ABC transporter ATP-binding protein [Acidimicrobiia bacterium]
MLGLTDVWFRYGRRSEWVLRGATLDVPSGKLVALVGPSGSGKSTVLGLLAGYLDPIQGSAHSARSSKTGWIFQTSTALGVRNTLDNIALSLLADGMSRREALAAASALADRYGLAHVAHQSARTLSGGELQRLAVARAEATRAPVLFCDEPTAQLDAANSALVAESLRMLAGSGTTVIAATHVDAVEAAADAVFRLSDGKFL